MNFIRTEIADVVIIEPKIFQDNRGYFFKSFRQDLFEKFINKKINFIQENESKSHYGVLRGLHFQKSPFAQAKLVRVIQGSVIDIAVDLRKNSKSFKKYIKVELSAENKRQLFIPRGFALVCSNDSVCPICNVMLFDNLERKKFCREAKVRKSRKLFTKMLKWFK